MQNEIAALNEYVLKVLGIKINPKLIDLEYNLPVFLKNSYGIYSVSILDKHYFLAVARDPEEATPAQISKHMEQLEERTGKPCIYIAKHLPAYNRQRLVAHRIRFVIPGTQMYLPDLGLDCRKTTSKYLAVSQTLTPSAQAILIYALTHGCSEWFTPSELAKKLRYPRMTMTRALDVLEALGLGKTIRKGKERCFSFQKSQYFLWSQALPLMSTPVKESPWIQVSQPTFEKIKGLGYVAGLSALAKKSTLIPPSCPIFALSRVVWKALLESENIHVLPIEEGAQLQVEVWNYNPDLFDENYVVDPFSLYLSLKDREDERIEKALNDLIENVKW